MAASIPVVRGSGAAFCGLILALLAAGSRAAAPADFAGAVVATRPIAYFRLESADGGSETGSSKYTSDGARIKEPGAVPGMAQNHYARFDGHDDWIETTLAGGIGQAGSIMAWVQLATLPSASGHGYFIAGESQANQAFSLQIDADNVIRFFGGAGQPLGFAPDADSLAGHWHMLVATVDAHQHAAVIYWDGKAVARASQQALQAPAAAFCIGGGKSLADRYFAGGIDEVAVWDQALSAEQVLTLYAAAGAR